MLQQLSFDHWSEAINKHIIRRQRSGHVKDITGQRFGLLTVKEFTGIGEHGGSYWLCKCDCGGTIITSSHSLIGGNTKSCGCLHIKQASELCKRRNTSHGHSKEDLYFVWKTMRQRCNNPKQHDYKWYGAKGVKICPEWDDYEKFREWALNHGYKKPLTIDRIDFDKGYSPDNCRFITIQEQQKNKSNTKRREAIE